MQRGAASRSRSLSHSLSLSYSYSLTLCTRRREGEGGPNADTQSLSPRLLPRRGEGGGLVSLAPFSPFLAQWLAACSAVGRALSVVHPPFSAHTSMRFS